LPPAVPTKPKASTVTSQIEMLHEMPCAAALSEKLIADTINVAANAEAETELSADCTKSNRLVPFSPLEDAEKPECCPGTLRMVEEPFCRPPGAIKDLNSEISPIRTQK
jgi:hypothetical protein